MNADNIKVKGYCLHRVAYIKQQSLNPDVCWSLRRLKYPWESA